MPLVTIEAFAGRSVEQKRDLVKGITDVFVKAYKVDPESVTIVFHDLQKQDLAKAGVLASDK